MHRVLRVLVSLVMLACFLLPPDSLPVRAEPTGPFLFKDINTRTSASSDIGFPFMEAGPVSYFFGEGGLWKTDGKQAGTIFIKALFQQTDGHIWDYLPDYALMDGTAFFRACDYTVTNYTGCELWKTDGTATGTVLAADLNPGEQGSYPRNFTLMGGKLYFVASEELWRLDSASAAPVRVLAALSGVTLSQYRPRLWAMGDRLYFSATDTDHGTELWVSNGDPAGTTLLIDLFPGANSSYAFPILVQDDLLYFAANNGESGSELWVYDRGLESFHTVSDINAYSLWDISMAQPFGSRVFFRACPVSYSPCYIYSTDGMTSQRLFEDHPEQEPNMPVPAGALQTAAGARLLFFGSDSDGVYDLWETDGTEAGTARIYDSHLPIPYGIGAITANNPGGFFYQGRYYFSVNDPTTGTELWQTDGTFTGTGLVKDIWPGQRSSSPDFMGLCGKRMCFLASDGDHGRELWSTDGFPESTSLVADFDQNPAGSDPSYFVQMGKWLYFVADDWVSGLALWRTDGTPENTQPIWTYPLRSDRSLMQLTAAGNRLYFVTTGLMLETELWISDGFQDTHFVMKIAPGGIVYYPDQFVPVGNDLYFFAEDSDHGTQLWKADGDNSETIMLTNFPPGYQMDDMLSMYELDGKVIFSAFHPGEYHYDLWHTDGTLKGTEPFAEINHHLFLAVKANGKLFFRTYDSNSMNDLPLQTDGTGQGTHPVPVPACLDKFHQVYEPASIGSSAIWIDRDGERQKLTVVRTDGDTSSCVSTIAQVNDYPRFQSMLFADNGKAIYEMFDKIDNLLYIHAFVTDGTPEGTGVMPSDPRRFGNFAMAGPFLYFSAYNKQTGQELWVWDGTENPAQLVADILPGTASSFPSDLYAWNGRLFFAANDGLHGDELWAYYPPIQSFYIPVVVR